MIEDMRNLGTIQELSAAAHHQECLKACQNTLQANPEETYAYKYAGKSLLALGQFEKAQQCLAKAHQLDGSDPEVVKDIGNIFNALQNDVEAIRLYKAALSIEPNYAPAINNLGMIAKRQGDLVTAEQLVKKARDLDQSFAPYHMNLGGIYKDLGQLDQALAATLKSLELKPDNHGAHMNLGLIYKELGQLDQALAATLKSVELKPDNHDAHMNLGGIYKDLDQLDQALATTLKSLELKPDNHDAHMNLGGIYKELGQLDQALTATLKSLELKPNNPTAHMNLGGIYKELGQLDQALAATMKSLELKADNHDAHMNLGGIYKELGQLDQALAATMKSLELKPDNPDTHMNLGGIYKELGQIDQALAYLKEAVTSEKTKEKAANELAQIYYYRGNYRDGVNTLSDIYSKKSGNLLLSLYLCLNEKLEFIRCANDLAEKRWLNPQGIAAIDHANILYNLSLDNGLDGTSMNSVFVQRISEQELSDALIEEILIRLSSESLQTKSQGHLANGTQTSGNILDIPEKPFQTLKDILVQKIDNYNQACDINTDKNFKVNLQRNLYTLGGWAIIMDKGGSLKSHNHESGWLTGTFYLQMPEEGADSEEGAIEFSHQGPKYPEGTSAFETRVIRPKARDLNIFSSALFHRTLPFQSETQRICIAFDVTRNEKL